MTTAIEMAKATLDAAITACRAGLGSEQAIDDATTALRAAVRVVA